MDASEQEFQKRLAIWQVSTTIAATVGTALLAGWLSLFLFTVAARMNRAGAFAEDMQGSQGVTQIAFDSGLGHVLVVVGFILMIQIVMMWLIHKQEIKAPVTKSAKT